MPRTPHHSARHRARPATAALAAATVLAGLLAGAVPSAAAAERPRPRPRRPLRGRGPLRQPARRRHLHLGQRRRRPADAGTADRAPTPPTARRSSHGTYDISGYGGFSHDFAVRPARPATGPRTRASGSGGTARTPRHCRPAPASGSSSRSRTAAPTARRPSCGTPPSPTTGRAGTWSRSRSADFVYRTDYQPVGGIDQVLGPDRRCGATRSPCRSAPPASSRSTASRCTARPTRR